jgi:hypothetical protein
VKKKARTHEQQIAALRAFFHDRVLESRGLPRLTPVRRKDFTDDDLLDLVRAREVDRARGRRGAAKARRIPKAGHMVVNLAELLVKGVPARDAAEQRAPRRISPEQRAQDEVAVLEALPVANYILGGTAPDSAVVQFLYGWTGISQARVEKVIQRINLHPGVHTPVGWGLVSKIVCRRCKEHGRRECWEHVPDKVLFSAMLPRHPPGPKPSECRALPQIESDDGGLKTDSDYGLATAARLITYETALAARLYGTSLAARLHGTPLAPHRSSDPAGPPSSIDRDIAALEAGPQPRAAHIEAAFEAAYRKLRITRNRPRPRKDEDELDNPLEF